MSEPKNGKGCEAVEAHLAELLDGGPDGSAGEALSRELEEHLADCDACRDRVHDARAAADAVAGAGAGYVAPIDLEARFLSALEAREGRIDKDDVRDDGVAHARASRGQGSARARWISRLANRRVLGGAGVAFALAAAAAVAGVWLRPQQPLTPPSSLAQRAYRGTLELAIGGASNDAIVAIDARGARRALAQGGALAPGERVKTDARTRARLSLDDGTRVVLDRDSEVVLDATLDRTVRVLAGAAVIEGPTLGEGTPAKDATQVLYPGGTARFAAGARGARLSIDVLDPKQGRSALTVARGEVVAKRGTSEATLARGEGAVVGGQGEEVRLTQQAGLGRAFGWSELSEAEAQIDDTSQVPGIGELYARPPGGAETAGKKLRIAKERVSIKIAGEVARTEVDETFTSDDPAVLEGVYRFPLPPDAQIERLALEVDGHWEEGAFVDRSRAEAIWRGVTYVAAQRPQPIAPPREQWIWIPGPWRDPALLEWKQGGRMELKIYPIPAKGSRRVAIAYTQRIAPASGVRRYVYPLPRLGEGKVAVEDFAVDLQVLGHEPSRGVRVRGYDPDAPLGGEPAVARTTITRKSFVPGGDLVVEYERKDEGALAKTYAWTPATGGDAYVALSLSPKLARVSDGAAHTHVIVLDSSRSMYGERWTRASALAARVIEELDERDRVALLACDVACTPLDVAPVPASKQTAARARAFLAALTPEGASDLGATIRTASAYGKNAGAGLRVVYLGDGAPTVGARGKAELEAIAKESLPEGASLHAVAIGVDADTGTLDALARGGGGVVMPYVPGATLSGAALDVIEATAGATVRDVCLTLPAGLTEIAPAKLGSLRAGEERLVVARMKGSEITGSATLEGTLAGKHWSTQIPLTVRASSEASNAFVPRLFAAATIADLESRPGPIDRAKLVELSRTFAVPSRATSLLVLESPAMAKAFGVTRTAPLASWTGNEAARGETTAGVDDLAYKGSASGAGRLGDGDAYGMGGFGPSASERAAGKKAAPPAMPKPAATAPRRPSMNPMDEDGGGGGGWDPGPSMGGHWQQMREEWYRTVTWQPTNDAPAALEAAITKARTAALASPDARDTLVELFGLVSRRDDLSDARMLMSTWVGRDPLDPEAILRRAELVSREGERARAIRVSLGALDVRPDDVELADSLATVALRAGDAKLACALRGVRAEVRPEELEGLARRVVCLRDTGDAASATRLLASLPAERARAVEAGLTIAAVTVAGPSGTSKPTGDLVVDATWSAPGGAKGVDLDLALVDEHGVRWSWTAPRKVEADATTSTAREGLGLSWVPAGDWSLEVVRADVSDATPVSGTATVRFLGETKALAFGSTGPRTTLARFHVGWASRWVAVP
jgi:hypothetical protein